jgi:hypothetical protein
MAREQRRSYWSVRANRHRNSHCAPTCLNDFTAIWDVLTPENRGRLLRAVVQQVEVDEPANRVKVFMVDLCEGLPEPVEAVPA